MIISHKHKFVFLQTTKTGSSSICVTLKEKYKTMNPENHLNAVQAKRFFDEKKYNWDEYFKFAFVRNPWDRYVSAYYYRKKTIHMWKSYNKNAQGQDVDETDLWIRHCMQFVDESGEIISFERWVKEDGPEPEQLLYYCDVNENKIIDFIGRFENFQEDFNTICDKIGIPRQKLPSANKTKHKHYTEYYDDETRQIVAEKYKKDIEMFGYEFGE